MDFPDPLSVNPRRPASSYHLQGGGFHQCMGIEYVEQTVPEIIKAVFRLKGIRRAEGAAGRLAGFELDTNGTASPVYIDATGNMPFWPVSLTVVVSSSSGVGCERMLILFAVIVR